MEWFRFYHEALDDSKVQELPGELFKAWVNIMCLANQGKPRGTLPRAVKQIAFRLRMSEDACQEILRQLRERKLLDYAEDGETLESHNFLARQYDKPSDIPQRVGERVKRHREKEREQTPQGETPRSDQTENVTPIETPMKRDVTPGNALYTEPEPDTESETDLHATPVAISQVAPKSEKTAAHAAPPNGGNHLSKPVPKKERPKHDKASHEAMFEAITETYGIDIYSINKAERGVVNGVASNLLDSLLSPDDVPRLRALIESAYPTMGTIPPTMLPKYVYLLKNPPKVNGKNGHLPNARAVDRSSLNATIPSAADQFDANERRAREDRSSQPTA